MMDTTAEPGVLICIVCGTDVDEYESIMDLVPVSLGGMFDALPEWSCQIVPAPTVLVMHPCGCAVTCDP